MDERGLTFRVGVVVVAAATILIILITLLGAWPNPFEPQYTLHILFPSAPGVTDGTPVRKSGISIGRVSKVELWDDGVMLTLTINSKYPVRANEICHVRSGSLVTGDAILEFVKAENRNLSDEIVEDMTVSKNGQVDTSPFEVFAKMETQIGSALDSIKIASDEVSTLARNVNGLLGTKDDQLASIVKNANTALENFNLAMTNLNTVLGDDGLQGRLYSSLDTMDKTFADTQNALAAFQTTLTKFNGVAARAESNLASLEGLTAPLGERGEEITENVVASIKGFNTLVANFAELSASLKNQNGTVGQLINSPELYDRLNRTMSEIETLVRRLEPIINDVRVITDKVARDPSQFGVKGLLDRRPAGAGQKYPVYPQGQPAAPIRLGDERLGTPIK